MKKLTSRMIRVFPMAAAVLLGLLLAIGTSWALHWSFWAGLSLVLLLSGGAVGGFFLRRLWLRHRERQFVQGIVEPQDLPARSRALRRHDGIQELRAKWSRGIRTLRRSRLKKQGNPIYVLPWYLILGESGTGKTSSLERARLASPFPGKNRSGNAAGTRNLEWWFCEEAVVIDTAGRYAIAADEEADRNEWRALLRLVLRYRRREPLNGVVVTVAADQLLTLPPDRLAADAREIRRRIDQLMRGLAVRFPVYVLVTKCDLVEGISRFAAALPERTLDQAMGVVNQDLTAEVGSFVHDAFTAVTERLRNLRLQLLLQPGGAADPGLVVFPEEFSNVKDGLLAFVEAAFAASRYQESPILRGIFFSSAQQNGAPQFRIADTLGVPASPHSRAAGDRGWFLHDFFTRILPADRNLFAPSRQAVKWRVVTGNLGLLSWVILVAALCGLLTLSFVKNVAALRLISSSFPKGAESKRDLRGQFADVERLRRGIVSVEGHNRHWWIPRFGLNESLKIEQELKARFCRQFHEGPQASFDVALGVEMDGLTTAVRDQEYGPYVVYVARRINLIKARLKGSSLEALKALPQPGCAGDPGNPAAGKEAVETVAGIYPCYLSWRADEPVLRQELIALQGRLKQLLALKESMQWYAAWVDLKGASTPVTLADFWGGSRGDGPGASVPAAFTRKGKQEIETVAREIEAALPEAQQAGQRRAEFERWYRQAASAAWESFAAAFPRGMERLKGQREWQEAAARMVTDQSPYLVLVDRMVAELGGRPGEEELTPWLRQLYLLEVFKRGSAAPGALEKATDGGKKLLVSLEKKIGKGETAREVEARTAGARAMREYRAALAAIAPAVASRAQAFQAAAQVYAEDSAVARSPFPAAFAAGRQLEAALAQAGGHNENLARLIEGPLQFLWEFVRREAAGHLQSQWEEQVLSGTMGLPPPQATPVLLGPDGLAWRFVKGPAAPFLSRSVHGYRPKQALGGIVEFEPGFFSFLERGNQVQAAALTRQANYGVGIQGLPTDVNPEARVRPHCTRLELQCGGSSQTLVNLNYPAGRTFNWSPEGCGDVQLQIEVGDLVLTRRYAGAQAFPEFLQAFPGGQRVFTVRDFPGERGALAKMGITYVKVNYHFTGSAAVVKQGAAAVSARAPRSIVRCWTY